MEFLLCIRLLLLISLSRWVSLSSGAVPVVKTVVVDLKGHGHFRSIQQAINSIPNDNPNWTKIHIKAGVYW
ncbi:putative pectinesterase 68 [Platanthera guangdongensis]|uniref:Pectinesterase 68 n=1 Tax=Platanthera guangdongensis TaxID=2320717 RepID=A0ABR2M455_9ASPA